MAGQERLEGEVERLVYSSEESGLGRTVQLHPQEALLQQARALQQSEAFAGYRQRRVVVEHRLARLVQLGIRQARYFGRTKTLSKSDSIPHGTCPITRGHQCLDPFA